MLKYAVLISVFFFLASKAVAQTSPDKAKKGKPVILFVCEHGAARSTIAAAYFNKLAKERKLGYTAVFRGTEPDTILTPATAKGLKKDGFDVAGWKPTMVSSQDMANAYKVVVFDCKLPNIDTTKLQLDRWDGIPPISKDYDLARNQIVEKVNKLIAELPKKQRKR